MNPITCSVCIATFATCLAATQVKDTIRDVHITPVWQHIFSQEEIAEKGKGKFIALPTIILQLQGIKDIVNLQMLYIESICKEKNALTVDIIATQKSCERLLQELQ